MAYNKGQKLIVPPREEAVFNEEEESWMAARNDAICQIMGLGNDGGAILHFGRIACRDFIFSI